MNRSLGGNCWAGRSARTTNDQGFSTVEVVVALVLVSFVSLASWRIVGSTLGIIGKSPTTGTQQTARLRTVAVAWVQAELEYAKQLGYEGLCAPGDTGFPTCTLYVPSTDCSGQTLQGAPLSEGPGQPAEFPYGRVVVSWDSNTPVDSSTTPATNYLQLVEVDAYRTQADCQNGNSYLTGYTSVGIR